MKKLLTATLVLLVLAAFPGLSAAQEKKQAPDKPKGGQATLAYPPADKVTLSGTNPALPHKPCPVTAKPGLTNTAFIYSGWNVYLEKLVGSNWIALSQSVTNSQGVASGTVPRNTKIRAYIIKVGPTHEKAYSNEFTCYSGPSGPSSEASDAQAQDKKQAPDKPKGGQATLAGPPANTLTLSPGRMSREGAPCPVIAKPVLTGSPATFGGYHVYFEQRVGNNQWMPLPKWDSVTNSQGVAPRTVPRDTRIRAYFIKSVTANEKVYSNEFLCGADPVPLRQK